MEIADPGVVHQQIDPARQLISSFKHRLSTFLATQIGGDDLNNALVSFWANTDSIFTNDEKRDGHLRSGDFFDSEKFPKLSFKSTRFEGSGSTWKLTGDLTIKDVTRPVTLDVEWSGQAKDPWGNTKAGLNLSGTLDRKAFGLTWNAALEAGGVLVSDEVRILAEVQLAKQG